MSLKSIQLLSKQLKEKRGDLGVRVTAKAIGISPATLSRVERGNFPDLETFSKICRWLDIDPADFLGLKPTSTPNVSIHFRKSKSTKPQTSKALAELIFAAQEALEQSEKVNV